MSITKKFAELLGGTIGVESEVRKGSTFTVRYRWSTRNRPDAAHRPNVSNGDPWEMVAGPGVEPGVAKEMDFGRRPCAAPAFVG